MLQNYETFSTQISTSEAFELVKEGTMNREWTSHMRSKWQDKVKALNPDWTRHMLLECRNVIKVLITDWICPHCGFLSFGYTEIQQLDKGVQAGHQCCSIVLEAVHAWHQSEAKSFDGLYVYAWVMGHFGTGDDYEVVGSSVILC